MRLAPRNKQLAARQNQVRVPQRIKPILQQIGKMAEVNHQQAYAVGGCVRDWLLGKLATVDWDVAVEGNALVLARKVSESLKGSLVEHAQFGTATVAAKGWSIDFATCRRESYASPAAYPKVVPGSLQDDLFRRDFTINAMAVCLSADKFGQLIDPFVGYGDLQDKQLRLLHARSFEDDPSRILRGIRFAQRFGFSWEPDAQKAAIAAIAQGLLGRLNAGRMAKELEHMADEPNPGACVAALASFISEAAKLSNR